LLELAARPPVIDKVSSNTKNSDRNLLSFIFMVFPSEVVMITKSNSKQSCG
jgi:hypothetical protein